MSICNLYITVSVVKNPPLPGSLYAHNQEWTSVSCHRCLERKYIINVPKPDLSKIAKICASPLVVHQHPQANKITSIGIIDLKHIGIPDELRSIGFGSQREV